MKRPEAIKMLIEFFDKNNERTAKLTTEQVANEVLQFIEDEIGMLPPTYYQHVAPNTIYEEVYNLNEWERSKEK